MKFKNKILCSSLLLSSTLLGQDWQVGGNPGLPIGLQVTPTKNFIGSNATNDGKVANHKKMLRE